MCSPSNSSAHRQTDRQTDAPIPTHTGSDTHIQRFCSPLPRNFSPSEKFLRKISLRDLRLKIRFLSVNSSVPELTARFRVKITVKVRFRVIISVSVNDNNSGVGELTDTYRIFFIFGNFRGKIQSLSTFCRQNIIKRHTHSHSILPNNFYARKQLCFQRVLAIAILSVCPSVRPSVRLSVTRVDQAKTVQARISKFLPSAAWKTLVSGAVKLFHKFEGGHPERGR